MILFPDVSKKNDAEVVRLALNNPDYFVTIVGRYEKPLARYIRRISNFSQEDIEDALQEIFIKVYKNLNGYDESLKFSSWIYRIAHNHVIDQFRKKSTSDNKTSSLDENEFLNFLSAAADVEKEIENKDCVSRVKDVIEGMPIKYKEVLILRFLEGKTYDEIMDILRKPKGTVATLIGRGREMLREKIKEANINCF